MENKEQIKNELGHIYGSRISKNGKWLNLIVTTIHNGENIRVTCPVRLSDYDDNDGKPIAALVMAARPNGERYPTGKVNILGVPVYEDVKPKQEQEVGDLPF